MAFIHLWANDYCLEKLRERKKDEHEKPEERVSQTREKLEPSNELSASEVEYKRKDGEKD